jgi:hypothetical protein
MPWATSTTSTRSGCCRCWFEKLPEGAVTRGRTSVDVCALGGIVLVEALVCKRQRPPQFPLRPYKVPGDRTAWKIRGGH